MSGATGAAGAPWAVILAGGVGSRFWPMSTPERPKQLLPLVDEHPLLVNTLDRMRPLVPEARTLVLTNATLRAAILELCPDLPPENVIAEPAPAGTAAALAWAAREVSRRAGAETVMMCVHADWAVGDPEGFRETLARAAAAAERYTSLVTVGIVPTRDDPGFGYIQPGALVEDGVRMVARFVEKPTRERAARMRVEGYLWNSGIFVWRAGDFLEELAARCPEVAPALHAVADAPSTAETLARFFADVTPVAVDIGVMERSPRVLVLAGDFGWDDVGTWGSLGRVRRLDGGGNAAQGPAHLLDARSNVVHAEGNAVILYGVEDLVVVTCAGLTLVTTVERSSDLKTLIGTLPPGFGPATRVS